jgi:hypothetical protein
LSFFFLIYPPASSSSSDSRMTYYSAAGTLIPSKVSQFVAPVHGSSAESAINTWDSLGTPALLHPSIQHFFSFSLTTCIAFLMLHGGVHRRDVRVRFFAGEARIVPAYVAKCSRSTRRLTGAETCSRCLCPLQTSSRTKTQCACGTPWTSPIRLHLPVPSIELVSKSSLPRAVLLTHTHTHTLSLFLAFFWRSDVR